MPIKIPNNLPAREVLQRENIFVMDEERAFHQDIRPLQIVILNLMPNKEVTETQLLRLLGNNPLQVDVVLLHPKSHQPKNTSRQHLATFYKTFDDISSRKFDGMIITGAPIEHLEYNQVNYWDELRTIMDWTKTHITSTLHICWGAMAGLFYHYDVPKHPLDQKLFGVFPHRVNNPQVQLVRGFDEVFYVPHSRHWDIRREDILQVPELEILAESEEAGVHIVASRDGKQIFVLGHSEYDATTLHDEYERDKRLGKKIHMPHNYYPDDDPTRTPRNIWRAHGNLLFANWLNYYVYQETPYDLNA